MVYDSKKLREHMFFEESVNIREAIQRVTKEIFPLIRKKFSELEEKNTELLKADHSLAFSFNRLKKEFEGLSNKFELLWVPAVVKCLETSDCQKPFNGFTIIRASHIRQRKGLLELRNMCDAYVMEESWEQEKKQLCFQAYQLETAYLKYLNFMESTLIPMLKQLSQSTQINES